MDRKNTLDDEDKKIVFNALICYQLYLQNERARDAMKGMCEAMSITLREDKEHWDSDTVENIDRLLEKFSDKK